jgi:hypothetical protein
MATITLTGEEKGGGSFDVAPAGRYMANVYDAEETTSQKGDPMIKMVWEISNGDHEGTRIWNYLVLNEKGMYNVRQCIEALGVEWVKGQPLEIGNNLVGRTCEIDVKIDLYQGKEKNAIKFGGYHATEATKIMAGGIPF